MSIIATQEISGLSSGPIYIQLPPDLPGCAKIGYIVDDGGVPFVADVELRQAADDVYGIRIPADATFPFPIAAFEAASAPRWLLVDPSDVVILTVVRLP